MTRKTGFIGLQNGDEGKGKIISWAAAEAVGVAKQEYDLSKLDFEPVIVERFQGGTNAGHTVKIGDITYKLHLTPSGIVIPHVYSLVGAGVFGNPRKLLKEIKDLWRIGVKVDASNFGVAARMHVTIDYHTQADQPAFNKEHHTSTGNGIKETAMDKAGRVGIRFVEFLDRDAFKDALERRFAGDFLAKYGIDPLIESYTEEIATLREFLVQEHEALATHGFHHWIGEGAQGASLDMDVGRYPGVTSSNPASVPRRPDKVVGVVKLYESSVGTGDRYFVSRIREDKLEEVLRGEWNEFGTTTGKGREVGWFDAVEVKYNLAVSGADTLAGTCGDRLEVLARLGVKPKIVVAYKVNGREYDSWDVSFHKRGVLENAEPVFEEFEPWERFQEDGVLTDNAVRFTDRIQELTGKEFGMLGTGPGHKDMIVYTNPLE